MADLPSVLPKFDLKPYSHLLHSLRKNGILVTDLISLDPIHIARKCPLPLLDVRRLVADVISALQQDLSISTAKQTASSELSRSNSASRSTDAGITRDKNALSCISTLDATIDNILGGGFPAGHLTEIVGERYVTCQTRRTEIYEDSAVGKTQLVLGLLLSVQLPPPRGLGMSAIYLGTEAPLNTKRLEQILESGPAYQELSSDDRPTFQRIHSLTIHDFKAQQAVVENHLSHAVEEYNVGLVVIDSVAANFRAYHNSSTSTGLKQRAAELIRLGAILRRLAKERNIAVIVTNQVSDRFVSNLLRPHDGDRRTSSPATSTAPACQSQSASSVAAKQNPVLTLDHQQCFFTGWGNDSDTRFDLKNPALGLAWANQLSARLVLKLGKDGARTVDAIGKRKRCVSLVFSSWGPPSKEPVQYSIEMQGVVSGADQKTIREHEELLDETLWDIANEDEEFP